MAASDTEEERFRCSVCLEYLKDPKLLPDCLHRFCKMCLDGLIRTSPTTVFKCPICNLEYVSPGNGVEEFKTDFLVASLIESKQKLEKPSSIPTPEGCHLHSDSSIRAICSTCGNLPVCASCVQNYHVRHNMVHLSDKTTVADDCVLTIEVIKTNGWKVYGMTSNLQGSVVLTGEIKPKLSFILVLNIKGRVLRTDTLEGDPNSTWRRRYRYCAFFSRFLVATACHSGQVGIYDIRDGAHVCRNMTDIFNVWRETGRYVTSVAVDPEKELILVGTKFQHGCGRGVLVFDNQLDCLHTLMLPEMVEYPGDLVVDHDNLLVVDKKWHSVFIVTMDHERKNITSCRELVRPSSQNCQICDVCTVRGSIYMLWATNGDWMETRRRLTKYDKYGREILETRVVDSDAFKMCADETDGVEKLYITTRATGELFSYDIATLMA